jgi:hypothetical protein
MNTSSPINTMQRSPSNILPWAIAVGAVAFAVGAGSMFVYSQNQQSAQNEALQALTMQVVGMQQQNTVTRNAPNNLLVVPTDVEVAATPEIVVEPVETVETINASGVATTTVIAADPSAANTASLEEKIAEARAIAAQIKLDRLSEGRVADMLTESVIAGDYSVNALIDEGENGGVALVPVGLSNTAGILAELIATSVDAGEIVVPDYIPRDETGNVDSQTLLFDLIQRSLENGTTEEIAAAAEMRRRTIEAFTLTTEAPVVEAAAVAETTGEDRYYIVEPGDNLAYISLQFYGSTGEYVQIFEANKNLISSPDRIQVGQRLIIPNV